MMYFIPWVVFLLVVILSVPVVSFMEKRKRLAARGPIEDRSDEHADSASDVAEDESGEAEFSAVDEMPGDGNELAEFEELR